MTTANIVTDMKPGTRFADRIVWIVGLATLIVHLAVAGRYDFFRNELYFIICGRHPDFGYVDQPPLVPLLAAATQMFGENLWLLRLPAVLAAAALVPVTAMLARHLGGGVRGAWIAAVAVALPPALAALTSNLGTSTFEPLCWTLCAAFLVAAAQGDRRALIWAGVVAGISLEIKYAIAIWLVGLCAGVALTEARRMFAWREFWIGAAIAVIVASPSLFWQAAHGWPFLAIIAHHSSEGRFFTGGPLRFLIDQALAMNIALAPLWLAGVIGPFVVAENKAARILAIAFLVTAVAIFLAHGKNYYLFPVYPALFAAGAAICARLGKWLAVAWMVVAAALLLPVLPVVLPLFAPDHLARYLARTHLAPAPEEAAAIGAPITQLFSDQFAWRDVERRVAAIYHALPPNERMHAAILASNYGEAAALDFYGTKDSLPPALSGENQYFLWGPRGADGSVLIHVNGDPQHWRSACASITDAGTFGAPYAMPYENNRPIFICRGLHPPLPQLWPMLKRYR